MKRLTLALLLLTLTACRIYDGTAAKPGTMRAHREQLASCQQALEQGWCDDKCKSYEQPAKCCAPKNVRCSPDGLCMWEGCNGALVFGTVGP